MNKINEKIRTSNDDNIQIEKKIIEDILHKNTVPRLWKDNERGMINLLITYLGIFASWQIIFNYDGKQGRFLGCNVNDTSIFNLQNNPFYKLINGSSEFYKCDGNSSCNSMLNIFGRLFILKFPTFANLMNTSYQFYAPSNDINLPNTNILDTTKRNESSHH